MTSKLSEVQVHRYRFRLIQAALTTMRSWPELPAGAIVSAVIALDRLPAFDRGDRGSARPCIVAADSGNVRAATRTTLRALLKATGLNPFERDVLWCVMLTTPLISAGGRS